MPEAVRRDGFRSIVVKLAFNATAMLLAGVFWRASPWLGISSASRTYSRKRRVLASFVERRRGASPKDRTFFEFPS